MRCLLQPFPRLKAAEVVGQFFEIEIGRHDGLPMYIDHQKFSRADRQGPIAAQLAILFVQAAFNAGDHYSPTNGNAVRHIVRRHDDFS